jgi:heme-degrading monooxygenase HmoA
MEGMTMILEIADIHINAGQQTEFEAAVGQAMTTIFAKARGFRGHQIRHSIETPERYILLLSWDTLEDHTVGFRGSALFTEWRSLVSAHFAKPPYVEHFELVDASASQAPLAAPVK